MAVPTNPYNCIGSTLYELLFRYDRTAFQSPTSLSDTKQEIDNIISNIATFELADLAGRDFPQISIADFCADVPYKEISCRVQDGVAICEDDRPAINASQPVIITPQKYRDIGKIVAGSIIQITTNIPATGTVECLIGGVWTKSASTITATPSATGGTVFTITVLGCIPIPATGLDCRFKGCDNCCNDEGEFEQNCDTVTYKVFPCESGDTVLLTKSGWLKNQLTCPQEIVNLDTLSAMCSGLFYQTALTDNLVVGDVMSNKIIYFAVPSNYVCETLTLDNFSGCADAKANMTLVPVSQVDVLASSAIAAKFVAELSGQGAVAYYKLTVGDVITDCTLSYNSNTACGGQYSITIPVHPIECNEDIIIRDKDCVPTIVTDGSEINVEFTADYKEFKIAICPPFGAKWTIRRLSDNSIVSQDADFNVIGLTLNATTLASWGVTLPEILTVEIEHPYNKCPNKNFAMQLLGTVNGVHLKYGTESGGVCLSTPECNPTLDYFGTGTANLTSCVSGNLIKRRVCASIVDSTGTAVNASFEFIRLDGSGETTLLSSSGTSFFGEDSFESFNPETNSYKINWTAVTPSGTQVGVFFFNFSS